MSPGRMWIALGLVWALFFFWYTSFGGPLEPDEIEHYLGVLREAGAPADRIALLRAFMESDTGDDFAMQNLLDLRDAPVDVEGLPAGSSPQDVMAAYTRPFMGRALRAAAHPVFMGQAAAPSVELLGIEGAERWETAALVRYRSRRDLMNMVVYLQGVDIHDYKLAALEKTIAFPIDPWFHLGDPRLLLALLLGNLALAWHLRSALRRAR